MTLIFGFGQLDGGRDSADEPSAADRRKHRLNFGQVLQDFESHRALASNDFLVIVGRDDDVSMFGGELLGAEAAFFAARADE